MRQPKHTIKTAGLGLIAAWALSACVATTGPPHSDTATVLNETVQDFPEDVNDDLNYSSTTLTVRAGLKGISDRYIEDVDLPVLALDGMRGLATIDPGLALNQEDGMVQLRLQDASIAEFARPISNDPTAWASLTSNVIRAARTKSMDLRIANEERIYEAVFDGMLAGLDVFSRYSGAEEARVNRARRDGFGGIGIRFAKSEGAIVITHVQEDGPAANAGLQPGDMLLMVNQADVTTLSLRQIAKRLRGPVGSRLTLSVARLDDDVRFPDRHISYTLSRAHIVPDTVRSALKNGILHIRLTGFNKKTTPSLSDVLKGYEPDLTSGVIKGVIMDLRDNPGGLLSQSVNVADLFLDQGRIIATRGRHPDSFHDYRAGGSDLIDGKPLVILVDAESASAAEIVASALQDLGRAVVVGSSSYGKGTVQTVIRLPNNGEMTLTWSRLVAPHGYALHGLGVMPSVCVTNVQENTIEAILAAEHIDGQRETMAAWHAAGLIFDGRRSGLRKACPARTFKPGNNGDLLMDLANGVLNDPALYRRAILLAEPINTASR